MPDDPLDNSMQETEFGPLPAEWPIERLGALIEKPQYGLTASAAQKPTGPRFLRITDIQDGRVNWPQVPSCECSEEEKRKYELKEGDLVIARIGATTGKAFLIRESVDAVFASYLIRIRALSKLSADFLDQFTQSALYWNQINSAKGGRLKQGVNIPVLQSLAIPIPPLEEQRAIAHVLRTVQQAKEATEKVIVAARQLKQSLMRHLFTYGPVPVEEADQVPLKETEIGPIPEQWRLLPLAQIAKLWTGTTPSTERADYYDGSIPLIKTAQIINERIRSATVFISEEARKDYNLKLFPKGTVFLAMYGQGKTRGQVGLLEIPAVTTQNTAAIVPTDEIQSAYLWYYLMGQYRRLRDAGMHGQISHLNLGYMRAFLICVPSFDEQAIISMNLEAAEAKLAAEETRRHALESLFQTLLHHLITGKVRVNELKFPAMKEDEP